MIAGFDLATDHIPEIRKRLTDKIDDLAPELLGQPLSQTRTGTLKFGRKSGSLHVETRGRKRGLWIERGTGEGGGCLELIRHVRGGTVEDAAVWAIAWLGLNPGQPPPEPDPTTSAEIERQHAEAAAQEAQEAAERLWWARTLWAGRKPLAGTVGEQYLRNRDIMVPANGWPECVAYLPDTKVRVTEENAGGFTPYRAVWRTCTAVIVAATGADGLVYAVQRIFLDHNGQNIRDLNGDKVKRSNGLLHGAAVRLPGNPDGPLMLTEGPETGLSVWAATGYETHIALGSMPNHVPPPNRIVIVCRDDDAPQSDADKGLHRALGTWWRAGIDARVATPWRTQRGDRSDFNDVLQAGGVEAVRARIDLALNPEPAHRAARYPVAEARNVLTDAVANFFHAVNEFDARHAAELKAATVGAAAETVQNRPKTTGRKFTRSDPPGVVAAPSPFTKYERDTVARRAKELARHNAGPPPVHGIKADVGVGKSDAARRAAAIWLSKARERGDRRVIVFAVPTAKLGHEQAERFMALPEAAGLVARVRLGMERPDPEAPNETMCRDLDAVADANKAMADVQTSVCQQRNRDGTIKAECQFFNICGYQKQRQVRADIWFMAHETLFVAKPKEIGEVAIVIVDEAPWHAGLIGHNRHIQLSLDTLHEDSTIPDAPTDTALLQSHRARLADLLRQHDDGPLTRAVMVAAGFTAASAGEARVLEWRRKVDAKLSPSMTPKQRAEAVEAAAANRTIARLAMVWRAVAALVQDDGPAASGWAELATTETENGKVRVLRLKGRKEMAEGWRRPTLLLDATMQPEPLRYFWPTMQVTADIAIETPHQRVIQVRDRTYSKNHLRHAGNFRDVRAALFRVAHEYAPGRVLCVIQQEFEEKLREGGNLPGNLDIAHHNAIAGRDEWRDVAALIVAGRTAPSPRHMEQLAEALSGEAIEPLKGWYQPADAVREIAGGARRMAQSDRHPHDLAEACRWSVTEAEIVQIIGRARGCNRTAANPVDVLVMCDAPLPIPVDRLISASDLEPSPGDLMAAEGGVELANATDAAKVYPTLWPSRDAARKAMEPSRGGTGPNLREGGEVNALMLATIPYKKILVRECRQPLPDGRPGMVRATYQLAGRGKKAAAAWFDIDLVPDPSAWVEAKLGRLSRFDMVEPVTMVRILPELAAVRSLVTATDAEKLAARAVLRPTPDDQGPVPLIPGGHGDPLASFAGMTPISAAAVSDGLTIHGTGAALVVIARGIVRAAA